MHINADKTTAMIQGYPIFMFSDYRCHRFSYVTSYITWFAIKHLINDIVSNAIVWNIRDTKKVKERTNEREGVLVIVTRQNSMAKSVHFMQTAFVSVFLHASKQLPLSLHFYL